MKLRTGLILVCALLAFFFFKKERDIASQLQDYLELQQMYSELGRVVFARCDIPEGTIFTKDYIEERTLPLSKIPGKAIVDVESVVGVRARFGVLKDQILSGYDLDPYPGYLPIRAVTCVKRIRAGPPIKDDAVTLEQLSANELPKDGILNEAKVLGRIANTDIEVGQILLPIHIQPRKFENLTLDKADKPR